MEQVKLKEGYYIVDTDPKIDEHSNVDPQYKLLRFDSLIDASNYERDYCQNNYHKFYVRGSN